MTVEKPLNIDAFFMSRNEIANRHGEKLELQAVSRVREHMVEEGSKKKPVNTPSEDGNKQNANQGKKEK